MMRERAQEGQRWTAWQNHAMGSADLGRLQFIKVGPGCTLVEIPSRRPDTNAGCWLAVSVRRLR